MSNTGLRVYQGEIIEHSAQARLIYNDNNDVAGASPDVQSKIVVLFGETGVGKSSVINLMADSDIADTSSDIEGCTSEATRYLFTLLSSSFKVLLQVFDTVGVEESETGVETLVSTIEKAQKLIRSLHNAGGVDLLLFCVRAGRFTASMERNYHLFSEILCDNRVPLGLVITHLENEDVMENWWNRNEKTFKTYKICAVAHACLTALPAHVMVDAEKRVQSRRALEKLFYDALNSRNLSRVQRIRYQLATFIEKPLSLLMSRKKRKMVAKKLETYCMLPPGEAQRLAKLIVKG